MESKMSMVRYLKVWLTLLLLVLATAAEAATVSGTVTNSSGKSGWVYLTLNWQYGGETGLGTAVKLNDGQASSYSIVGATDGSYVVTAYVDTTDTGMRHANDPSATPQQVNISGGLDASEKNLTIIPMVSTTGLNTAVTLNIQPTDGGAFVSIDDGDNSGMTDSNGRLIPDKFNFSCNSGAGTYPTVIPANDNMFALMKGLTNGSTLNCTAVPVVNGQSDANNQGSASAVIGDCNSLPAVFGACPVGSARVTGKVAFDQSVNLTGKSLYVALSDEVNGSFFISAAKTLTNPATFDAYGVTAGAYKVYGVLDDGSHTLGLGDVVVNDRRAPLVVVDGVEPVVAVPTVTLKAANAEVNFNTVHSKNPDPANANNDYSFTIQVTRALKQPATVTLKDTNGNVTYTLGRSSDWGEFWYNTQNDTRPQESSTVGYMDITYTDGSAPDTNMPGVVGKILDNFPSLTFPVGDVRLPDNANPLAAWRTPNPIPGYSYTYQTWLNNYWDQAEYILPQDLTSNFNLRGGSLPNNSTTNWELRLRDMLGNLSILNTNFTPRDTGPVISGFSPTSGAFPDLPAAQTGLPLTITGSEFTGATAVSINGVAVKSFSVVDDNTITAITADNTMGNGPILVTAGGITGASSTPFDGKVKHTGYIREKTNTTGINGATIKLEDSNSEIKTTSDNAGFYTMPLFPAGVPYTLKITGPLGSGLVPTYTKTMSQGNNGTGYDWNLWSASDLTGWGITPGKGVIRSRVSDTSSANIGGATVTATSLLHPDAPYTVRYTDPASGGNPSATATATEGSNGRFYVMDVEEGDVVTVKASAPGYAFVGLAFQTHVDSVSQGRIIGAPVPTTITPSLPAGSYNSPQAVSFNYSPAMTGGNIWYTTNGLDPRFYGTSRPYDGTIDLPVGTYTLRYIYRNDAPAFALASAGSVDYTIIQDSTPPTVTVIPAPNSPYAPHYYHYTRTLPLTATFSADEPATIYYTTNGATPTTSSPSVAIATPGGTASIPITQDMTALQFFGKDAAGNQSFVQLVTYALDGTSPVINSVTGGGLKNSRTFSVGINTSDNLSGVVQFMAKATNTIPSGSDPDWSSQNPFDVTVGSDGPFTYYAFVKDVAGNISEPFAFSFTVDTAKPAAPALTVPAAGATLAPTVTVTGTAEAGSTVTVKVGANVVGSDMATNGSFSITTTPLAVGPATLSVTATDAAGNESQITSRPVTIAPSVAKVGTREFLSIQAAYDDAATVSDSVLMVKAGTLTETITFGRNVKVTLDGGYNAAYGNPPTGTTKVNGKLLVRSGIIKPKKMVVY